MAEYKYSEDDFHINGILHKISKIVSPTSLDSLLQGKSGLANILITSYISKMITYGLIKVVENMPDIRVELTKFGSDVQAQGGYIEYLKNNHIKRELEISALRPIRYWIPIIISFISLAVAIFSLVWVVLHSNSTCN